MAAVVVEQSPNGAAFTRLPNGLTERYHFPTLAVCTEPACALRHATHAELNTFAEDDRARDFEAGWDAAKGER